MFTFRGFFSEQLDDLGGRTLRWESKRRDFKKSKSFLLHQSNELQPLPVHLHNIGRAPQGVGVKYHAGSGRELELQAKLLQLEF